MSVDAIAAQRVLSPNTIESHLAYYVSKSQLDIAALVPADKENSSWQPFSGLVKTG